MFCPDLNGYKFWDEICRVDQSVYLLFDVIFAEFLTVLILSGWFISKPRIASYRIQLQLVLWRLVSFFCVVDHDALCS